MNSTNLRGDDLEHVLKQVGIGESRWKELHGSSAYPNNAEIHRLSIALQINPECLFADFPDHAMVNLARFWDYLTEKCRMDTQRAQASFLKHVKTIVSQSYRTTDGNYDIDERAFRMLLEDDDLGELMPESNSVSEDEFWDEDFLQ